MIERRTPKNIFMRKEFNDVIGKSNIVRCRAGAFALCVFMALVVIIIGTAYVSETNVKFIVPGGVFALAKFKRFFAAVNVVNFRFCSAF